MPFQSYRRFRHCPAKEGYWRGYRTSAKRARLTSHGGPWACSDDATAITSRVIARSAARTDVATVAADGRLQSMTGFIDRAPEGMA
ncbi:hypothetical protein [Cupriavidus basilensis]|uniref:hypothetical protein n=1 Tax=Cupriavidus basilensis TaxID=68895 RepID=UPI0020C718C3|nr:hypothetical protein [Cupriavidus basilensis]